MQAAARTNRLLAALPEPLFRRLAPYLKVVELKAGQVLSGSSLPVLHAWFPTTAIVSLLYGQEGGLADEVALVGREGVIGVPIVLGAEALSGAAVVQCAGWGLRLDAAAMKAECQREPSMLQLLLRYTQALITQVAQMAVCNRHHSLDQQLSRLLLHCLDKIDGDELVLTHEQMARMLGVRRGGVTEAALALQQSGAIRYARGRIAVLDRAMLEARACCCYRVVKEGYRLALGSLPTGLSPAPS